MESWIEYEIEFKHTCPQNMKEYIDFIRTHHRVSIEKISQYLSEYVNIIQYGIIATNYGHVLTRKRIE